MAGYYLDWQTTLKMAIDPLKFCWAVAGVVFFWRRRQVLDWSCSYIQIDDL